MAGIEINQKTFPEVFQPVWKELVKDAERVRKSFKVCGMFPWNPKAVQLKRLVKHLGRAEEEEDKLTHVPATASTVTFTDLGEGKKMLSIPVEDKEAEEYIRRTMRTLGFNIVRNRVSEMKSPNFL